MAFQIWINIKLFKGTICVTAIHWPVRLSDGAKLVDTADPSVSEHQGSRLQVPLPPLIFTPYTFTCIFGIDKILCLENEATRYRALVLG